MRKWNIGERLRIETMNKTLYEGIIRDYEGGPGGSVEISDGDGEIHRLYIRYIVGMHGKA